MEKFLIIAAGGTGTRMGGGKIKQFIILAGKPLLMHTISVFHRYDNNIKVILSLPPEFINQWNDLCIEFNFGIDHTIVEGGDTRYHSVKNALGKIHSHGLVAIHDSVRPFVSIETIKKCFDTAEKFGNAIPVTELIESVRIDNGNSNSPIDREKIRIVQTPQVFRTIDIKKAYLTEADSKFTDDASVLESSGYKINLVKGNIENIKITTPFDLIVAHALIKDGKFLF